VQELYLLGHQQRAELRGEAFDEILVREHGCPMRATIGVIIKLPEMSKLINRPGVALKIPDELFVLPAFLKRREANFLIELHRLCHLADMQRVGSQFVERHRVPLSFVRQSLEALITCHDFAVLTEIPLLRLVVGHHPRWASSATANPESCAASGPCTKLPYRTTSAEPIARQRGCRA
jgi:hypothetical protein